MAKRVILAVAGAGKTYYICHKIKPQKRNLILAFTNENIHNIKKELCDAYGSIPELTTVLTYDSFVYHNLVLPYEPSIGEYFNEPTFVSNGISMMSPPPMQIVTKAKKRIPNPNYETKDKLGHYVAKDNRYYCDTLSELVLQIKKNRESLVKRIASRLNMFYDSIFIDEFQDFREHDYELIMTIAKHLNDVTLVGDYYQHSVSGTNNSGKPFKRKKNVISYDEFIEELKKKKFEVDTTTLDKSRRCPTNVCSYVKRKLGINITSCDINRGFVIWADDIAEEIIENHDILKLVYQNSEKYIFNSMNWGYSKGDTVDNACVILTEKFDNMNNEEFIVEGVAISTLNKLYVAMTRSKGNLYLIKADTFKKIRDKYIKEK